MKPYVYHAVEIVDFKAEPKQVTYILAAGGKGFFVLSDDTSSRSVVRRRTTVGRLLDKDWRRGNTLNYNFPEVRMPYKGLSSVSASSELCAVNGEIFEGRDNYALTNVTLANDKPSKIASLFAKPLLRQLEHYLVPEDMAEKVREYAEENKK
jgi:hypothetical protein